MWSVHSAELPEPPAHRPLRRSRQRARPGCTWSSRPAPNSRPDSLPSRVQRHSVPSPRAARLRRSRDTGSRCRSSWQPPSSSHSLQSPGRRSRCLPSRSFRIFGIYFSHSEREYSSSLQGPQYNFHYILYDLSYFRHRILLLQAWFRLHILESILMVTSYRNHNLILFSTSLSIRLNCLS